jgi:hypothetical protein
MSNYSTNLAKALAVLALLGGLTTAAAGPIIYPFPSSSWPAYASGWGDGSNGASGPIIWGGNGTTTDTLGWCAFDADTVTISAYTSAVLRFYQYATSGTDNFKFQDAPDADPLNDSKATLYSAMTDGNSRVIGQDVGSVGWHTVTLSLSPGYWPPPQADSALVIGWIDLNASTANSGAAFGAYNGSDSLPSIEFFK